MRILICGIDGYIGWPLALHLLKRDHEVCGLDSHVRRDRVKKCGSDSLTPIPNPYDRYKLLDRLPNFIDSPANVDMTDQRMLEMVIREFKPDAIVHLAEQPSAAWSMKDLQQATETQSDNVLGTLNLLWAMRKYCPEAHLLKLGTMGEYGTPECDIPEGEIPDRECKYIPDVLTVTKHSPKCLMSGLQFPRSPGSFYHLSKVHDTYNIIFACKNWGLRSTDIMQGIVFGLNYGAYDEFLTRFDYDECFGTAINRFCAQILINHPLTIYGAGGQTRGFLPLSDSLQCLTIALENPPTLGEYRTFNQFENIYSISELGDMVCEVAFETGISKSPIVEHITNPRNEKEAHYYNPIHQKLLDLGYKPTTDIRAEVEKLLETIVPFRERVIKEVVLPKIKWC